MKVTKINLMNFTQTQLLARLTVLQMNFNRIGILNFATNEDYLNYCKKLVIDNFIFDKKQIVGVTNTLALFLIGNDNNQFSKVLDL